MLNRIALKNKSQWDSQYTNWWKNKGLRFTVPLETKNNTKSEKSFEKNSQDHKEKLDWKLSV